MTPVEFRDQYPGVYFLDPSDLSGVGGLLRKVGLLGLAEPIGSVESAGEGNMNCTVRVLTNSRSFIVKQARPWVEKYPQFAAPWDRALREAEFYQLTANLPAVAAAMPKLLAHDVDSRVLVLEDLGRGGDYNGVYRGGCFSSTEVGALASFLSALHQAFAEVSERPSLPNREMRALNHDHVFQIPLAQDNGLDLDRLLPGLSSAAAMLKQDDRFISEVARLGKEAYLADGPCLLHGDFFPGSFVRTVAGPRVIDPEFCFFGRPEWDVGVFLAHLWLGAQSASLRTEFRERYRPARGFDDCLALQFAGVEIMRRLIGYAQLPLDTPLAARQTLLELARTLVLRPTPALLAQE